MRGAFIIGGYGAAAALYLLGVAGRRARPSSRWPPGSPLPLALATAVYTAYLFAQAKGARPVAEPAAAAAPGGPGGAGRRGGDAGLRPGSAPRPAVTAREVLLAAAAGAHVLLVLGEIT